MPPWAPGADNAPPRLRGEHPEAKTRRHTAHGSSPLTRGAPRRPRLLHHVPGLIPAYAGSTRESFSSSRRTEAHPRLRGEHFANSGGDALSEGSSPLTRGAHYGELTEKTASWLIPAYAGSTLRTRVVTRCPKAHPRLRGEHIKPGLFQTSPDGSSPLTRGALHLGGSFLV